MGFFDNLSKKATETYKNTTDKTNKMAREMKLKSYIGENKNRIERVYTVIGRKVYEKHVEGKVGEIDEYIKPEIEEIEEIARKIENMNNEIRTINNIKLCEKCASEISLDSKFCPKCGAKQEENTEVEDKNSIEAVVTAEPVVPGETVENNFTEESTESKAEPLVEEESVEIEAEQPATEESTEAQTEPTEIEENN